MTRAEALIRFPTNQDLDPVLQRWLNRYMPPPTKVRPPGYVAGGAVRERVRKRAEVQEEERKARKARVDHIVALREGSARRMRHTIWIRPPVAKSLGSRPLGLEAMKKREEARARKARVADLERLREKSRAGRAKRAMGL